MANITLESLKRLFPLSISLKISGNIEKVFLGISEYLENCRIFAKNIQNESIPTYSVQLIDSWLWALGLPIPFGADTEKKQEIVKTLLSGEGGQSLNYINSIIQSIFPDIHIEESSTNPPYPQYYNVRGEIDYAVNLNFLRGIVKKICPLYLDVFYFVRPSDASLGICGIGDCGEAITGKNEV